MDPGCSNRPTDPRLRHPALNAADALPLDLRMDLLVDGELPEEDRRAFLRQLDHAEPGCWRDLAIRFLQRQTEKETAHALMAGGRLVPVELLAYQGFWARAARLAAPLSAHRRRAADRREHRPGHAYGLCTRASHECSVSTIQRPSPRRGRGEFQRRRRHGAFGPHRQWQRSSFSLVHRGWTNRQTHLDY